MPPRDDWRVNNLNQNNPFKTTNFSPKGFITRNLNKQ